MLIGLHNTHVLSSFNSSSNGHSYNSDLKINIKNLKSPKKIKQKLINAQLSKLQMSKINDILSKYNLAQDRTQKIDSTFNNKNIKDEIMERRRHSKTKKSTDSLISADKSIIKKSKKKAVLVKDNEEKQEKHIRNNSNNILNLNNNISNTNQSYNIFISNNNEKSDENKKENYIIENYKDINIKSNNINNDAMYAMSYKSLNRETRFNNIQKNIEIQKKMTNKKNILLLYEQNINSRNLLRSINKPEISFITKINKKIGDDYFENKLSDIRLNVKNNLCFFSKKIIKKDELIAIEKQIKKEKFRTLKKENEEENIPTFSSINTSSSNSQKKIKENKRSKTKLKSKKNNHILKPKIKSNNKAKMKKSLLPKEKRSISNQSKISNEKSEEDKTISSRMLKKIPNVKKKETISKFEKKPLNSNKDNRKLSNVSRPHDRFLKKNINDKNKISISNSIRNLNNYNSPFKNNSLLNLNKLTEGDNNKINNSAEKDKDKQNNELDFKKFLEEQKLKRSNQIRNFIKKKGMNSYNFFYPKEPSPLLGIFKNKYSVYPTLNINRKNIEAKEERKHMRNSNDELSLNHILKKGNISYRKEKKYLKNIFEEKEDKEKNNNNLHIIEKHYGNENDCPLCRTFKLKNDDEKGTKYFKSIKYNKLRFNKKINRILNPNSLSKINLNKINDLELMSRNRIGGFNKNGFISKNQSFRINKNFNVLFDYFLQ